jgi:Ribbon-helix-helix protein, copG family
MGHLAATAERESVPVRGGRTVAENEVWVNTRVSKETKAALEEWAHKTRRSVSYLLRRLAEEAIEAGRAERGEQI